ncbi:PRD domain-containing protein [Paenibacillaceae bacterium]|nr:PRD domain-containing protein [Paenibacillaceae bacterium]
MKVSNRQRKILEVLLNGREEVTAGQLAQAVQISSRTIHRELQELEPELHAYGLSLVKKSGLGILLEGDEQQISKFQSELRESDTETYSPDERKLLMLSVLLEEEEPVKLFSLAREAQAAIPTVSRDLEELEPQLKQGGLQLIRKRGYGVEITGAETAKRSFIVMLAERYLEHSDFLSSASPGQTDLWPTTRKLLHLVGKDAFMAIEQSLWQQNEAWLKRLNEADYTRLLIRLSVAVIRIKRGHRIGEKIVERAAAQRVSAATADNIARFAASLGLEELSYNEASYIQRLFTEAEERAEAASPIMLDNEGLELAERTFGFIRTIERVLAIPLSKDRSLLDGLIRHLGSALQRLRQGEAIRNPLLGQIKKDYATLFNTVRANAQEIARDIAIPDEEIGYLVMHFGAAIERWKLTPGNVRALLVCMSGIGSSKLLAVRITKEIPQIQLLGHYSWYEASRMPRDRYDLIVSTVDLPIESDRYIKLSPLLTREETERLRRHVRELSLSINNTTPAAVPDKERGAWERLQMMERYASEMIVILERFQVYRPDRELAAGDLRRLMDELVEIMLPEERKERRNHIAEQLFEREARGSVYLPDSALAFFHTRSEWVQEPIIALFQFDTPQLLSQETRNEAGQIFIMLAPAALNKQALEVLSEISAMLLQEDMAEELEKGDADSIRSFISRNMEAYMKTKLEWSEQS